MNSEETDEKHQKILSMTEFFETKSRVEIPIFLKKTTKFFLENFVSPQIDMYKYNFFASIRVNPVLGPYTVITHSGFVLGKSDQNGIFDVENMDDMYVFNFQTSLSKKSLDLFDRKTISGIYSVRLEFEQKHIEKVTAWLRKTHACYDLFEDVKYDPNARYLTVSVTINYGNFLVGDGEDFIFKYS